MNTHSFRIASIAVTLAAVALSGLAQPAVASEQGMTPSETVTYGDLNLNASHGVEVLYLRIHTAAQNVCEQQVGTIVSLQQRSVWETCVQDAVARAIAKVGNQRLTAFYARKNGKKFG